MGGLFSSPPKPKAPPAPPKGSDAADAEAQRRKQLRGAGRQGTILTSPTGVASPAPASTKTLLGQ